MARIDDRTDGLIERVADRLGEVKGVAALALGGSWARGDAHPDSDVDIGIYHHADRPSLEDLRKVALELDDRHQRSVITDYGEWGPWINGAGGSASGVSR